MNFTILWTVAVWYFTLKDHENVLKSSSSFRGVIKTLDDVAADAFGTSFDRSAIKRKCAIQLEPLWRAMTSHESRWKVITREKWLAVTPRPLLAVFEYYICLAFDRSCVLRGSFFAQSSFVLPIHYAVSIFVIMRSYFTLLLLCLVKYFRLHKIHISSPAIT